MVFMVFRLFLVSFGTHPLVSNLSKIERNAFVVARLNTTRVICASVVRTKHFKVYPLMLVLPLLLLLLLLLLMLLPLLLLFVVA